MIKLKFRSLGLALINLTNVIKKAIRTQRHKPQGDHVRIQQEGVYLQGKEIDLRTDQFCQYLNLGLSASRK